MLKNKGKIIMIVLSIIMLISTLSFATEDIIPGENARISEPELEDTIGADDQDVPNHTEPDPESHNDNLHLFGLNVVVDKFVDGNVYIFGKDVEIKNSVNGSLYVFADKVTFSTEAYIYQTIYVTAREVVMNGASLDFYATANKIDLNHNSFIIRDLNINANEFNFKGGVGRNAFVNANNFTFERSVGNSSIIYGNLNYSSSSELLDLSKDLVQGEINYSKNNILHNAILKKSIEFLAILLFTIVVFALLNLLTPKFIENSKNYIGKKVFKAFGIGIISIIATVLIVILLLFSIVGIPLGLTLLGVFSILIAISFTVTATCITSKIKEKLKFKKKFLTYIILVVITILLWLLTQIPYANIIITLIISLFGFGTVIDYLFTKNKMTSDQDSSLQE